jgi:hypothetical protein
MCWGFYFSLAANTARAGENVLPWDLDVTAVKTGAIEVPDGVRTDLSWVYDNLPRDLGKRTGSPCERFD